MNCWRMLFILSRNPLQQLVDQLAVLKVDERQRISEVSSKVRELIEGIEIRYYNSLHLIHMTVKEKCPLQSMEI